MSVKEYHKMNQNHNFNKIRKMIINIIIKEILNKRF